MIRMRMKIITFWAKEIFIKCKIEALRKLHLVGQVPPVRTRVCGDQVDSLLLQRVQRLRHVVRQLGNVPSEVPLQVRPGPSLQGEGMIMKYSINKTNIHCGFYFDPSKEEMHLVGDGELVVAGGDRRQVRAGVPAGESTPRCTWPLGGRAIAAPV